MILTLDYTVKSKKTNVIWLFKYDLNGDLRAFEILGDSLNKDSFSFLINHDNFPHNKKRMDLWIVHLKKSFDIVKGKIDLSFESFYNLYKNKVSPTEAKRAWKKLSEKDKIDAIISINHYDNYLKRNQGIAKAYPATFLNKRRWESDYKAM